MQIFNYDTGQLLSQIQIITLGVRDLASLIVHNEHLDELKKILDDNEIAKLKYKIIWLNETFSEIELYKYDVVGDVIDELQKLQLNNPIIIDYLNGKLYGYATSEIDKHHKRVTLNGDSHTKTTGMNLRDELRRIEAERPPAPRRCL